MFKKLLLISCLFLTAPAFADEAEDKAEFMRLYAEFNELYNEFSDLEKTLGVAVKLKEMAEKLYGKKSNNYAVVTYNLAKLYDEIGDTWEGYNSGTQFNKLRAYFQYGEYFEILADLKKPKDSTYVSQYYDFVQAEILGRHHRSEKKYANRLIRFAEDLGVPENEIADLEFNIALSIIRVADPRDAQNLLQSSHDRNVKLFGENHFKVGENLFWRAKLDMAKRRYKNAEERSQKALHIFENSPELAAHLIQPAHAFLIALYEETKKPELALKHVQALAVERPDTASQNLEPIYKIMPDFPRRMGFRRPDGKITMKFDVDANGKPMNIEVVESDSNIFVEPTVEAITKWRYAPTIRDGKYTETKGIEYSINFSTVRP